MSENGAGAVLLLLLYLWIHVEGGERAATCRLQASCVLPCPFDPGPEVVIHWLKAPDDSSSVHSFYHGTDQLGRQQPRYKERTALFTDQISKGNASLHIMGIQLADSGRYKCYTSTTRGNNEDFITVEVQAPVLQVSLELQPEQLQCMSEGIYPQPAVTWTPSTVPQTSISPSGVGLFSVVSSVTLSDSENTYTCNISTAYSHRSATYRRAAEVQSSGSRTEVPCVESESSIKTLVWTFNRTQVILEKNGTSTRHSPDWESRLELVPGSELVLKSLSTVHQGLYTCSLTTDQSTYLTLTEVTVEEQGPSAAGVAIAVVMVVVVVVLLAIVVFLLIKRRKNSETRQSAADSSKNHQTEIKLLNNGAQTGRTAHVL